MKLANFLNIDDAYDVIKMAMLHRMSCDIVWRHKDVSTGPHCNTEENLLFTTIYISFDVQSVCFLFLYQIFPYITPFTQLFPTFYQRGCKHLRRGNTQGKKTCNLRISIVPISNITFQTLCKRAFL